MPFYWTETACQKHSARILSNVTAVEISSPNYPGSYPGSSDCLWHIEAVEGLKLILSFTTFDVDPE